MLHRRSKKPPILKYLTHFLALHSCARPWRRTPVEWPMGKLWSVFSIINYMKRLWSSPYRHPEYMDKKFLNSEWKDVESAEGLDNVQLWVYERLSLSASMIAWVAGKLNWLASSTHMTGSERSQKFGGRSVPRLKYLQSSPHFSFPEESSM